MRKSLLFILLFCCFNSSNAQNVGIGTTTPGFPLNFTSTIGDKISLFGNTGNHYGFGIQGGLLQIHSDAAAANIAFGYGSSSNFFERMRILNAGTDGMSLNGRLLLKNGSLPLDVNQTPGVWLFKADNSGLLGFMGTQNNQNIGFFGGPANGGWGFTYNGLNSRVGIGTSNPTSSLNVNGQITVDQKNFGGYGGLLLKGNVPGSNYPNIAFTVKNNAATSADVVAAMIQGDLVNNAAGNETIDLIFLTSNKGLGGLSEKLRIKNNGNVGIGTANPNAPLAFPPSLGKKITLYPGATGDVGFAVAGNRLQIYADNPAADVAIGYDAAGTFNERFAVKPSGALAINGNTGALNTILTSGGGGSPQWQPVSNFVKAAAMAEVTYLITSNFPADIPGASFQITVPLAGKLVIWAATTSTLICPNPLGPCDFALYIKTFLNNSDVDTWYIHPQTQLTQPFYSASMGPLVLNVNAGTHTIRFREKLNSITLPPSIKISAYAQFIAD